MLLLYHHQQQHEHQHEHQHQLHYYQHHHLSKWIFWKLLHKILFQQRIEKILEKWNAFCVKLVVLILYFWLEKYRFKCFLPQKNSSFNSLVLGFVGNSIFTDQNSLFVNQKVIKNYFIVHVICNYVNIIAVTLLCQLLSACSQQYSFFRGTFIATCSTQADIQRKLEGTKMQSKFWQQYDHIW